MTRATILKVALGLVGAAGIYWLVCIAVFSVAMALGDADLPAGPSAVLEVIGTLAVKVLGFPFMLLYSSPSGYQWAHRVFPGDDSTTVFGLTALNSLIWGPILFLAYRWVRRRKVAA